MAARSYFGMAQKAREKIKLRTRERIRRAQQMPDEREMQRMVFFLRNWLLEQEIRRIAKKIGESYGPEIE